jgi:hypothetical protein
VSFAIVVLIPWVVEWCQLIFRYGPFTDNFRPVQVIRGQSEDSRKFCDIKTEPVTLNTEVNGGLIAISTPPSSGTELSNQFSFLVLINPKHVKDPQCLSFGDDFVEH